MAARHLHTEPITDSDDAIAQALQTVSVPALIASVVYITGDPSYLRSPIRPRKWVYNEFQGKLTDDEKQRLGDIRVVHSLEASQRRVNPNRSAEELARWRARPTHEHPLMSTHRSGCKSLVLGASADHVVGVDLDEGRALLADLLNRATTADKVYSHSWSVGDTVIWDNRGVLHRAAPYDPDSPREMLRTTVLGDEPIQ